mmetsp:Transcript_10935/g.11730  ORF Transcript_10935/g.11730 Transcript_10935/m.11730 type:complete len:139 (-) Transcript_10935:331-747(-)
MEFNKRFIIISEMIYVATFTDGLITANIKCIFNRSSSVVISGQGGRRTRSNSTTIGSVRQTTAIYIRIVSRITHNLVVVDVVVSERKIMIAGPTTTLQVIFTELVSGEETKREQNSYGNGITTVAVLTTSPESVSRRR